MLADIRTTSRSELPFVPRSQSVLAQSLPAMLTKGSFTNKRPSNSLKRCQPLRGLTVGESAVK